MKVKYITDPQDINAHLTGEVVVSIDAHGEETRVPVINLEADEVLSLGCPVPSLIVLLDIGASLSVPDEIVQQCADLRVYSQVMSAAGGDIKRAIAYVASEGDEAAAREQIAASRVASKVPAKRAKKAPAKASKKAKAKKAKKAAEPEDASYVGSTREGKRRGRQPAKKAKKTAVKKTKKGKRAAEPKGARRPYKPTQVTLPEPLTPPGDS